MLLRLAFFTPHMELDGDGVMLELLCARPGLLETASMKSTGVSVAILPSRDASILAATAPTSSSRA